MKKNRVIIPLFVMLIVSLVITSPLWFIKGLFFMDNLLNSVPNQKFYVIDTINIDGMKVWELKNVHSDTKGWFIMFYMINKKPETQEKTKLICKELVKKQHSVIREKLMEYPYTDDIQIDLYIESKELPKYYIETYIDRWHQRDVINDHIDERLATIYMDLDFEITDIIVFQ